MNFLRDSDGSAMVEFAVFLSVLMMILVGMVDYAVAIQEAMQLQVAATAGAAWGAIPGNEGNLSGMQTAATNAATGVSGFSVTATNLWTCSAGGSSVASTSTCSGGVTPYKYVVVKTSASVPSPLSFPGVSPSRTLSGAAIFQVPWSQ
ncbi:TadE/TadG family type IV pilus assembly protein [Granulicella aggregans]|uniref:TadE/TadG family type IV pilus assembly protein n=1 Tax=Granulicella aggregans TaxID=474949 RepID=UPI0021E00ABC|nr:pilus assembly protein [Granulicella aggregans]